MGYCGFRNAHLPTDLISCNNFDKEPNGRFFLFYENIWQEPIWQVGSLSNLLYKLITN